MVRGLRVGLGAVSALLLTGAAMAAEDVMPVARAFGGREGALDVSLSPDGGKLAIVTPTPGRGAAVAVIDTATGTVKPVLSSSGTPDRLTGCEWITNDRLTCNIFLIANVTGMNLTYTRRVAVDADGKNMKMLTDIGNANSLGVTQYGGGVIDWTGGSEGSVLMTRQYVPESTTGNLSGSSKSGLGVERVDTRTLTRRIVEQPKNGAEGYFSEGRGNIRVMALGRTNGTGYATSDTSYFYRKADGGGWLPLSKSVFNVSGSSSGFEPAGVDPDKNVVYGFDIKDGRKALYSIALDGSMTRTLVLENPQVDVDGLHTIGRQHRIVGASFSTEKRQIEYFDPEIKALSRSLSRALPNAPIVNISDASSDEKKLLVFAGSDNDPGTFYLLDRTTSKMAQVMPVRPELTGRKLGSVKPVQFPAADGTMIPAYLTLPPGSDGKNLPRS